MYSVSSERRSKRRLQIQLPVILSGIAVADAGAVTRDVSPGGVFFYTGCRMEMGQALEFKILMPVSDGPGARALCKGSIVRVEHSRLAATPTYGVAVQITKLTLLT